jgi:hypothetical protein
MGESAYAGSSANSEKKERDFKDMYEDLDER